MSSKRTEKQPGKLLTNGSLINWFEDAGARLGIFFLVPSAMHFLPVYLGFVP